MKYDNLPNQIKLRDHCMAMNEEFRLLSLMSVLCFDILYRQSINLINKKFSHLNVTSLSDPYVLGSNISVLICSNI